MAEPAPKLRVRCRSTIVIPARIHSTRLPRKMLLRQTGKPLIQHTYEAARRASRPEGVIVATDHPEILAAVRTFGGQAEKRECVQKDEFVSEVDGQTRSGRSRGMDRHPPLQADYPP